MKDDSAEQYEQIRDHRVLDLVFPNYIYIQLFTYYGLEEGWSNPGYSNWWFCFLVTIQEYVKIMYFNHVQSDHGSPV